MKLFEDFNRISELKQTIKDIFQYLIDDDIVYFHPHQEEDPDEEEIVLICSIPSDKINTNSFSKFFNKKKEAFDILESINKHIEILKKTSDNININFEKIDNDLIFYITEDSVEVGDFWKIGKDNTLMLDIDELLKILKVDIYIETSIYSNGNLLFKFKNRESLEKYKTNIIDKLSKIQVKGEPFVSNNGKFTPLFYKIEMRDRSYGNYRGHSEEKYTIEVTLNPNFKWYW